ncbi:hypothetical protein FEM48_Zijuj05G0135600 [Ziziphus jujuba var. spinosa]|uniref:FBD domain-containing protein n=1 Tax=Ziziphus jujuba var. spinosa TaxID=714518 RepID=A0A978VF47_ZIZJJ|nr:hypothetical protein FEM48_Zijuj05G0135600 [Ziziphus jujuba var. spinosa]
MMPPKLETTNYLLAHFNDHLKVATILGYSGTKRDIELIDVLKTAPALEKIVVHTSKYYKIHKSFKDLEEEKNFRAHAMEKLKPKIPANIEFVCL